MPMRTDQSSWSRDYRRIERAIVFIEENLERRPDLAEVARSVGVSEYHFQRLFSRMVGISPKRYEQFLTKEAAKGLLLESESLLDAAYDVGLSGPGRLHDLFVSCEAVTPGEFKSGGEGLVIRYGFQASPFGQTLVGITERGICALFFVAEGSRGGALEALREDWRNARLVEDSAATRSLAQRIFLTGRHADAPLTLYLRGTNFQVKVWEALLAIPPGRVTTYEGIAKAIGEPGAGRPVGRALGGNPIAFLIPCHRVIRKDGSLGGYRWGTGRKRLMLAWEAEAARQRSG